jgi:hypothetical protein
MDESTTYETGSGKKRKERTGEKEIRMEGKKLRATEKRLRGSSLVCSELGDYYNYAPLSGTLSPISSRQSTSHFRWPRIRRCCFSLLSNLGIELVEVTSLPHCTYTTVATLPVYPTRLPPPPFEPLLLANLNFYAYLLTMNGLRCLMSRTPVSHTTTLSQSPSRRGNYLDGHKHSGLRHEGYLDVPHTCLGTN